MRLKEESHNFKKGLGNFLGRAFQSQEINEKWMDVIYEYSLVVSSSDGQRHKVRTYKEYHSVCPSSELGLPPNPPPAGYCAPSPLFLGGGEHSLARKGLGESQFRRGAYTVRTLCSRLYTVQ